MTFIHVEIKQGFYVSSFTFEQKASCILQRFFSNETMERDKWIKEERKSEETCLDAWFVSCRRKGTFFVSQVVLTPKASTVMKGVASGLRETITERWVRGKWTNVLNWCKIYVEDGTVFAKIDVRFAQIVTNSNTEHCWTEIIVTPQATEMTCLPITPDNRHPLAGEL